MLSLIAALAMAGAPSPRQVADALFHAFNAHDAQAMASLYAESARLLSPDFCTARGKTDVVRTYAALFEEFPDLRDDVEQVMVEGDRVVVRFVSSSSAGASPFSLRIATFLTVRGGKIVEDLDVLDTGGRPCSE